jgi:YbgC/YbaW family acyl-CoA thioester hydrolase
VSNQSFIHPHRVTYADCTIGNHVYYANYLHILEAARGEFFRNVSAQRCSNGRKLALCFPSSKRTCATKPSRVTTMFEIEVWVTAAERVRLNFAYRITNQTGDLVFEGETFHVCMSLEEKMKRLPEEFVAAVKAASARGCGVLNLISSSRDDLFQSLTKIAQAFRRVAAALLGDEVIAVADSSSAFMMPGQLFAPSSSGARNPCQTSPLRIARSRLYSLM